MKIPPELTFINEGDTEPFARLCIEATFYWRGSMYGHAAPLVAAYRRALDAVKAGIVWFESGSMTGAKKLKADSLDMVPFWLTKAKKREDIHIMRLKGGLTADDPFDVGLDFFSDEEEDPPMGALSVVLPCAAAEKPQELLTLVGELAASAPFESGHCGYSLSWDPGGDSATDAQARMPGIAGRFLGVDLPKLNATAGSLQRSAMPALKTVQWLTYLGAPLVARLGGARAAKTMLASVAHVHDAGSGLLVQAGVAPTLGDTNRQMDVSAMRAVGKALAPLRVKNHAPIFGTRDQTADWLARFD